MGRVLNVNWVELHKHGEEFLEQADLINDLEKELKELFNGIDSAWTGMDADIYKRKSSKVINMLNKEKIYLSLWHSFLTKSSNKYVDNVENGLSSITRVDALFGDEETNK